MNSESQTKQNRRAFIKRTLATTAMLAVATACQRIHVPRPIQVDPDVIKKFGAGFKGRLILPTDPSFEKARRVFFWNPKTEKRPAIIALCAHPDDVMRSVEFARRHGLEIAVRGGGHSPCAWGISNGLVIDLSGMKQIEIDPAQGIGRVDAGVLSGEVTSQAGRHGLVPALGQSHEVGAAGVLLGGGLGWLAGIHGAACDNLLSARVVTADGALLSIDASSNPDLFWALRGGSGNFGITTSFECRLFQVGPVNAGELRYPIRDARPVMRFFRDFMAEAPDSFQATLDLSPRGSFVSVRLCHAGDAAETYRLLQPFRNIALPISDTVKSQHFAELAGMPPARTSHEAPSAGFKYVQTVYREQLSDEVIDQILDRVGQAPAQAFIAVSHYMHGQVCRVKPEETAFSLRKAGAVHIRINVAWEDRGAGERLMTWTDEVWRALRASSDERIYANYQSHEDRSSAEAVFGGNHARLASIKNKYDPGNIFRRNSNVQPSRV